MFELFIYGCSDDLIEIDGDWREEFYATSAETSYVIFEDGTIVRVNYEGDWYLSVQISGYLNKISGHHPIPYLGDDINGVPDYSEVVYLSFDEKPKWVTTSSALKRIR